MKSLLESILGSSDTGIISIIRKWFADPENSSVMLFTKADDNGNVIIDMIDGKPTIYTKPPYSSFYIYGKSLENGKWPFPGLSIVPGGKYDEYATINLAYCRMDNLKTIPDCKTINLSAENTINTIDSLPDHCENLETGSMSNKLSNIKYIKNLKLNHLFLENANIPLTKIKNCKLYMLRFTENNIDMLKPKRNYFDETSSKMIDEFIKNNEINPENIEYVAFQKRIINKRVYHLLERDEKKNLWKIKK
jgi:hypothetical protein